MVISARAAKRRRAASITSSTTLSPLPAPIFAPTPDASSTSLTPCFLSIRHATEERARFSPPASPPRLRQGTPPKRAPTRSVATGHGHTPGKRALVDQLMLWLRGAGAAVYGHYRHRQPRCAEGWPSPSAAMPMPTARCASGRAPGGALPRGAHCRPKRASQDGGIHRPTTSAPAIRDGFFAEVPIANTSHAATMEARSRPTRIFATICRAALLARGDDMPMMIALPPLASLDIL